MDELDEEDKDEAEGEASQPVESKKRRRPRFKTRDKRKLLKDEEKKMESITKSQNLLDIPVMHEDPVIPKEESINFFKLKFLKY